MKRVFFDTNVIIDAITPSRELNQSANAVLSASDYAEIEGCISFLTVANTAYILRKGRTTKEIIEILRNYLEGLTVLPMNNQQLQAAFNTNAPDFEDILQYECAKFSNCDIIVTSNTKHFKIFNDIKVISTLDFAEQFTEK